MKLKFMYRKNGGQVVGTTMRDDGFGEVDEDFFATVDDPEIPDGDDLSVPKIFDSGRVRDATPAEVSQFTASRSSDQVLVDKKAAKKFIQENTVSKKYLMAIVDAFLDEINSIRNRNNLRPRNRRQLINAILQKIDTENFD